MEDFLNRYPSMKRLSVTLLTGAAITLNKKFNLGLGMDDLAMLTGLAVAFLAQSAVVQKARIAGETAAAASDAKTVEQIAANLGGQVVK